MKHLLMVGLALSLFLSACETDLQEGHYTCDPNEAGACPDGWVCQLRGTDGIYRCYDSDGAYCQNGVLDPGEICDGAQLGEFTCESGHAICLTNCTAICTQCGNGRIELNELGVGEQCDDGNTEEGDGCSAECLIERSYCVTPESDECLTWCGDGIINGPELCEPGQLGGYDCSYLGYHDGVLGCSADCRNFEFTQCEGFCGDGEVQSVEACDGVKQLNHSCLDHFFTGGDLHCDTGCTRDFEGCFNSWNRQTVNTSGTITSIHGTDEANLFAVSMTGWVGQFNGETWINHQLLGDPMLRGVITLSPNDAWAVGTFGALWHFDGSGWTLFIEAADLHLTGIWGTATDNLYACGFWPGNDFNGYRSEGIILHWDGVSWVEVVRQAESDSVNFLSIHGSGSQDIWVAGLYGQVWHYDGTSWERLELSPEHVNWEFWSVHVPQPGQVAFSGSKETYEGFVLELDNGTFTEVAVNPEHTIRQIRGTSLADLWMLQEDGIVLRREVGGWRSLTQPTGSRFWSLWNDHPDTLWIGGTNGVLLAYAGEFETTSYAFPQLINRIWGPDTGDLYLVGTAGALHHLEHDTWAVEQPPVGMIINDLWGPAAHTIMAVGKNGMTALRTEGTWTSIPTGQSAHLMGVHGCGGSEFWAVGMNGTILRYDGAQWLVQTVPANAQLNDVYCVSPTAVFVVGNVGTILFFDGTTWHSQESGSIKNLNAVWGTSRNHVYAVGNDGLILFFDGSTWQPVESGVGVKLSDITGADARNIWVGGSSGVLLRYAGIRFSPVAVPGNPNLKRLHLQPNGRLLASNDTTHFMEYRTALLPQPFVTQQCPVAPLYCQEERRFDTTGIRALYTSWGQNTGLEGPEMAFLFQAPVSGTVTWRLDPAAGGARLIVLTADAFEACDTDTVLAVSAAGPDGAQTVTLPVVRNETYFVVIDAPGTATGTLTSTCTR